MSNRFQQFVARNSSFADVMTFMREMQFSGYDNEFDNSLVLRKLWESLEQLRLKQGGARKQYQVRVQAKAHAKHGFVLEVVLCDSEQATVHEAVTLMDRNGGLVVVTDVLTEHALVDDKPVIAQPRSSSVVRMEKSVPWAEAAATLRKNPRFSEHAVKAFEAVCKALKPTDPLLLHHIRLSEGTAGVRATFMVAGKPIQQVSFKYNT